MSSPPTNTMFQPRAGMTNNNSNKDYWNAYLAIRPKYTNSSFYPRILSYHKAFGTGKQELAYDLACGPAQVATDFLLKEFKEVVVSDVCLAEGVEERVREAAATEGGNKTVMFWEGRCEDLQPIVGVKLADMIVVAQALPLLDVDKAIWRFRGLLKEKGTLAVWFYGRPHFLSNPISPGVESPRVDEGEEEWSTQLDERCNKAYQNLADFCFKPHIQSELSNFERPNKHIAAWLDSIALPSEYWSNVTRHKWNHDCEMMFMSRGCGGMDLDNLVVDSRAERSEAEKQEEHWTSEIDRLFWAEEWTALDAERFILANVPAIATDAVESKEFARLGRELEKAMGGEEGRRRVCWPVVLVLATKK
jgi:trans-aconitate 3-methyltransferase